MQNTVVDRREFLKTTAQAGLGLGLLGRREHTLTSERRPKNVNNKRKYWIWSGLDRNATTKELKQKYKKLKGHGLDGLFISGGLDDREFEIIKECGLEVHTWMWTTNRGDQWIRDNHPDWYMVSRSGKSCFDEPPYVGYYRWVSPVIPMLGGFAIQAVKIQACVNSSPERCGIVCKVARLKSYQDLPDIFIF